MGERLPLKQEDVSSILTERTNFRRIRSSNGQSVRLLSEKMQDRCLPGAPNFAPVAQRMRAPSFYLGGRRFESYLASQFWGVHLVSCPDENDTDVCDSGGARTPACRVETHLDACFANYRNRWDSLLVARTAV